MARTRAAPAWQHPRESLLDPDLKKAFYPQMATNGRSSLETFSRSVALKAAPSNSPAGVSAEQRTTIGWTPCVFHLQPSEAIRGHLWIVLFSRK